MAREKLQKAFALLLTFSMSMSLLGVTAFAEGEGGEPGTGHLHNSITCAACKGTGFELGPCVTCEATGKVTGKVTCSRCSGSGSVLGWGPDCTVCGGDGTMEDNSTCTTCGGGGAILELKPCPTCKGEKEVDGEVTCPNCGGTCEAPATTACTVCEGSKQVPCTGDESSFSETASVPATCGADGSRTYTCSVCGASYTETIPATGNHNYTADGVCTVCRAANVDHTNHRYVDGVCACGASAADQDTISFDALEFLDWMTVIDETVRHYQSKDHGNYAVWDNWGIDNLVATNGSGKSIRQCIQAASASAEKMTAFDRELSEVASALATLETYCTTVDDLNRLAASAAEAKIWKIDLSAISVAEGSNSESLIAAADKDYNQDLAPEAKALVSAKAAAHLTAAKRILNFLKAVAQLPDPDTITAPSGLSTEQKSALNSANSLKKDLPSGVENSEVTAALEKLEAINQVISSASRFTVGQMEETKTKNKYQVSIKNTTGAQVDNIVLTVQLDSGLVFDQSKSYSLGLSKAEKTFSEDGSTLTITGYAASSTSEKKLQFYVIPPEEPGLYTMTLTGTVDGVEHEDLVAHTTLLVSKYTNDKGKPASTIQQSASNLPKYCEDLTEAAEVLVAAKKSALDYMEGVPFSFAEDGAFGGNIPNLGFKPPFFGVGYTVVSTPDTYQVTDPKGNVWTCVGFVPRSSTVTNYFENFGTFGSRYLEYYVYANGFTGADNAFKSAVSTTAAENFVKENNGVLYGQEPTEAQLQAAAALIHSNTSSVAYISVWYVEGENKVLPEVPEYGDLSIPAVSAVNYQPTSSGVTVTFDESSKVVYEDHVFTGVEILVTIDATAPDSIQVNLNEALAKAMEAIDAADGHNMVQPGDTMEYTIRVVNNSGKTFNYVNGSAQIGTVDYYTGGEYHGTGFEGYKIPAVSNAEFSVAARRIFNEPLEALGLTASTMSDEKVGEALQKLGYGPDLETFEEVTRTCLGDYYLNYFNGRYNQEDPAETFLDLAEKPYQLGKDTISQLAALSCGVTGSQVAETNPEVAGALYYLFYGQLFTCNGTTFYAHMQNNSQINTLVGSALSGSGVIELTTHVDGPGMANAFQNTKFGFGMQFRMAVPGGIDPGPGPGPGPDPGPGTDIPDGNTPTTDLPEEETPTTELPEEPTELPEEETPLAEVPETGDMSALWLAMTALSGTGLAGVTFLGRKKRDEE